LTLLPNVEIINVLTPQQQIKQIRVSKKEMKEASLWVEKMGGAALFDQHLDQLHPQRLYQAFGLKMLEKVNAQYPYHHHHHQCFQTLEYFEPQYMPIQPQLRNP